MTRALVPGGPDPRTNGLSNSMPLAVIASDGAIGALPTRETKRGRRSPTYVRTGNHSKGRSNPRSRPCPRKAELARPLGHRRLHLQPARPAANPSAGARQVREFSEN